MKFLPRPFFLTAAAALAVFLDPSPRAHGQAMEFFDDFFSDNAGQPQQALPGATGGSVPAVNSFIQWTVTNGTVDFVGGNVLGAFFYPTGRFVDLGGSTGQPGTFATLSPIVLVPGLSYNLSFRYFSTDALLALGGPGANTLEPSPDGPLDTGVATLGGQTFNFATSSADSMQLFSQDFVALTASSNLVFRDLGFTDPVTGAVRFDNNGVGIDGILVVPLVPEPASWALLATGAFAGLGGWLLTAARRRRALVPCRQPAGDPAFSA